MKTITVQLPETIDAEDNEIKLALASKLYEMGKLSLGQAAKLVGVSKRSFLELLSVFGVSIFNDDVRSVEADFKNA